jgi:hypothetical protein
MLELEASEENVVQCKLVHFDKLKAAELKAFIIARHPIYTKLSDVAHLKNQQGGKSTSEVQNEMMIMGHQILSCHVPVVRSFFILKKMLLSS